MPKIAENRYFTLKLGTPFQKVSAKIKKCLQPSCKVAQKRFWAGWKKIHCTKSPKARQRDSSLLQGCIFCRYSHPPEGEDFFKMFENSLPQASFFFFALVKFGEGFQERGGEFFQVFDRIYTPDLMFYTLITVSLTYWLFYLLEFNVSYLNYY